METCEKVIVDILSLQKDAFSSKKFLIQSVMSYGFSKEEVEKTISLLLKEKVIFKTKDDKFIM